MSRTTDGVTNWMTMFRWIVKLIRDEYDVEEARLTRFAVLERDLGLAIEDIERVLDIVAVSFVIRFPKGTLDEVVKLEELCMLASWLKGLYKRPDFVSDAFDGLCRQANPACG